MRGPGTPAIRRRRTTPRSATPTSRSGTSSSPRERWAWMPARWAASTPARWTRLLALDAPAAPARSAPRLRPGLPAALTGRWRRRLRGWASTPVPVGTGRTSARHPRSRARWASRRAGAVRTSAGHGGPAPPASVAGGQQRRGGGLDHPGPCRGLEGDDAELAALGQQNQECRPFGQPRAACTMRRLTRECSRWGPPARRCRRRRPCRAWVDPGRVSSGRPLPYPRTDAIRRSAACR